MKRVTVFRHQGYKITETPGLLKDEGKLYHISTPTGKVVLSNRTSLEEAKEDLKEYISTGGYKKWESIKALVKSKTYKKGHDIDPEIRKVVSSLNDAGYGTVGSCAGHERIQGSYYGFITFANPDPSEEDVEDIKSILRQHGLTPTEVSRKRENYSSIYFRRE